MIEYLHARCSKCSYTHGGRHTLAEWLFIFRSHHWLRHGGRMPASRTDQPIITIGRAA